MNYTEFKEAVVKNDWNIAALRCNEPPSDELLAVMDDLGLDVYEQFVLLWEQESAAWN